MEDWTVSWVSEIDHQKAPCRIWTSCNHVVETRCPMISRIPYVGRHADFLYCEDVFWFLMNDDDEVVNLLVFISFINRQ